MCSVGENGDGTCVPQTGRRTGRQADKAVGLAPPRLSYSVRVAIPSKRPPILGGACL